jgi:uncharacterized protein YbjT (DUF2867 family)
MRFVVTGATGHVGPELISILLERGHGVAAVVRDEGSRPLPHASEVEKRTGDLNHAESLRPALSGADGAFLLSGYDDAGLVRELRAAGVSRVALLSSGAVPTAGPANAVAAYHRRSEEALQESGIPATFLRPNSFTSNALRWLPQIQAGAPIREAFADVAIATNDPHDVAAVAAVGLTADEPETRAYRITGPEALTAAERVAILADVLGRELVLKPLTNEEAREEMSARMPAEYVDAFFDLFVTGSTDETTVLPTVAEVTGRPPRTFRQWVELHADEFD